MNRLFVAALASLVVLSSCHLFYNRIHGTGNVVSQSRQFSNFHGVEVGSAIELFVKQDSAYSVKVEVDDNLQQYVEISESGGTLYVKQRNNTSLDATHGIRVYVTAPEFTHLKASGASRMLSENTLTNSSSTDVGLSGASNAQLDLKTPKITVDVSGASDLAMKGETKDLSIEGSGSSGIKCFDLLAENTDVDISGATKAEVYSSVTLSASASGASDVYYKGKGTVKKQDASGAGSIRKAD